MAEAFKNLINVDTAAHAAQQLARVWPGFDGKTFVAIATADLENLAFKARAMQWADALEACLPANFDSAAGVIEAALVPALSLDDKGEPIGLADALNADGLSGWALWGTGEFVTRRGMQDVPRALQCLHAITQRFTAEFAIRPFIARYPDQVYPLLTRWTQDPSPHVRRLVSEGARPRLPWGLRLQALVADPAPSWPLLQALQDDPSAYVRRSVANHLNDIAKDHPDLVAHWVTRHLVGADAHRRALLKHASRSLVKQGHPPTLAAWGLGAKFQGNVHFNLSSAQVSIGDSLTLQATLRSSSDRPQKLAIDYAVHHVRANGSTSPKVFKGWAVVLAPGEQRQLEKRHSLRPVTTRQLYPGHHRVALHVNGVETTSSSFELSD
ncbi:DNA alkylation repair protein [Hydrogenophaga sp. PAMC20947]|uniref:DNA alkylation repair protein n=1 Tax=Hydrogenophaga sp. PAMC20947 TaxID=2565558 RepID=UPI00109D979A|nr:DNA alkylation repair protein [Hydrogenophaga sp. PAMC20947]QCB47345.1 DNA alkylation repair protein [Hydrogenophaga sp. PAMC20947]